MTRLELSREADEDLQHILRQGTAHYGEASADAYYFSFEASFDLLREYPRAGEADHESGLNLRRLHHGSHRIFYRHDPDRILIVRIIHHAQDLAVEFGLR